MYDVGQVVFVISDKHKRVLPVRVVEQVVRRTLDGETVEYKVQGDNRKQTYTLSQIGSNHFSSAEDVRKYMYENATTTIDEIVNEALTVAQSKYAYQETIAGLPLNPQPQEVPEVPPDIFVDNGATVPEDEKKARIKLPDGTYANVNVSIPGL